MSSDVDARLPPTPVACPIRLALRPKTALRIAETLLEHRSQRNRAYQRVYAIVEELEGLSLEASAAVLTLVSKLCDHHANAAPLRDLYETNTSQPTHHASHGACVLFSESTRKDHAEHQVRLDLRLSAADSSDLRLLVTFDPLSEDLPQTPPRLLSPGANSSPGANASAGSGGSSSSSPGCGGSLSGSLSGAILPWTI
jgi:hypothetical protein